MRTLLSFCILYFVALANLFALTSAAIPAKRFYAPFNRTSFPPDFVFGASSAAYQVYIYNNFNFSRPGKCVTIYIIQKLTEYILNFNTYLKSYVFLPWPQVRRIIIAEFTVIYYQYLVDLSYIQLLAR